MSERETCTAESPYEPKTDAGRWSHPDAKEVEQEDGYPAGDIVWYECPNCGISFNVELPQ